MPTSDFLKALSGYSLTTAEILYRLLEQLPPRDRLVLTLRFLEEKNVEQTAEWTGWSQAMVKVQTLRARRKLKRLFDRYERHKKSAG